MTTITATTLRGMTRDGRELAVVDLRDVADHAGLGHPLVAVSVPADRLAAEAPVRFPNRHARIVLLDDGGRPMPAARAARPAGRGRTTRHDKYRLSQMSRKCIEEHFGWGRTVGRIRQTTYRGIRWVDQHLKLTMTASNLIRIARMLGAVPLGAAR